MKELQPENYLISKLKHESLMIFDMKEIKASSNEARMVVPRLCLEQMIESPETAMFHQRFYGSLNQETCSFISSKPVKSNSVKSAE